MKKLGLLILMGLLLFTGCNSGGDKGIVSISSKDGIKKFDNKDSFVLVIGASTCSACKEYYPVLEKFVSEYKKTAIYYLEIDTDSSGQDIKTDFIENYLNKVQFTPATFIVEEGEIVYKNYGTLTYREFKEVLVQYGLLEE